MQVGPEQLRIVNVSTPIWVATDGFSTGNPLGFVPYQRSDGSFVEADLVQTTGNMAASGADALPQPISDDIIKLGGDVLRAVGLGQHPVRLRRFTDGSRQPDLDITLPELPGSPELTSAWVHEVESTCSTYWLPPSGWSTRSISTTTGAFPGWTSRSAAAANWPTSGRTAVPST